MWKAILVVCGLAFICGCEKGAEVSAEMKGFMDTLSTSKGITQPAEKFGFKADDIPLDLYELKEPKVTGTKTVGKSTCYTMNVKHGMVDSNVDVCWEAGKVVNIKEG